MRLVGEIVTGYPLEEVELVSFFDQNRRFFFSFLFLRLVV